MNTRRLAAMLNPLAYRFTDRLGTKGDHKQNITQPVTDVFVMACTCGYMHTTDSELLASYALLDHRKRAHHGGLTA